MHGTTCAWLQAGPTPRPCEQDDYHLSTPPDHFHPHHQNNHLEMPHSAPNDCAAYFQLPVR